MIVWTKLGLGQMHVTGRSLCQKKFLDIPLEVSIQSEVAKTLKITQPGDWNAKESTKKRRRKLSVEDWLIPHAQRGQGRGAMERLSVKSGGRMDGSHHLLEETKFIWKDDKVSFLFVFK